MTDLADDLLTGADEIARYLGKSRRTVYHLTAKKQLPTFKIGETIHSRKSLLDERFRPDGDAR